jgi:hypothetical protein
LPQLLLYPTYLENEGEMGEEERGRGGENLIMTM